MRFIFLKFIIAILLIVWFKQETNLNVCASYKVQLCDPCDEEIEEEKVCGVEEDGLEDRAECVPLIEEERPEEAYCEERVERSEPVEEEDEDVDVCVADYEDDDEEGDNDDCECLSQCIPCYNGTGLVDLAAHKVATVFNLARWSQSQMKKFLLDTSGAKNYVKNVCPSNLATKIARKITSPTTGQAFPPCEPEVKSATKVCKPKLVGELVPKCVPIPKCAAIKESPERKNVYAKEQLQKEIEQLERKKICEEQEKARLKCMKQKETEEKICRAKLERKHRQLERKDEWKNKCAAIERQRNLKQRRRCRQAKHKKKECHCLGNYINALLQRIYAIEDLRKKPKKCLGIF